MTRTTIAWVALGGAGDSDLHRVRLRVGDGVLELDGEAHLEADSQQPHDPARHRARDPAVGEDLDVVRAVQGAGELLGEDRVAHRVRGDDVVGAAHFAGVDGVDECVDDIVERDPAPPLLAVAELAAEAELELRLERRHHAAAARDHETKAQVHGADARVAGGLGGVFPIAHDVGEKALAAAGVL